MKAGDAYPCPRCRTTHVVEQPYVYRSTAERGHLYVTCRGEQYFVGQVRAADREEHTAHDR